MRGVENPTELMPLRGMTSPPKAPRVRIISGKKRKERGILSLHSLYRRATAANRAAPVPLTRQQILSLRQEVYAAVVNALPHVAASVAGNSEISLSNQQVALFRTLLGKVLPDLQATYAQVNVLSERLDRLSREELEAIASGEMALGALSEVPGDLDLLNQVKDLEPVPPESVAVSCHTPTPLLREAGGADGDPPAPYPPRDVTPLPADNSQHFEKHGQPRDAS